MICVKISNWAKMMTQIISVKFPAVGKVLRDLFVLISFRSQFCLHELIKKTLVHKAAEDELENRRTQAIVN